MKRLNIVTLGVNDLTQSKKFYCDLFDWLPESDDEGIVFFNMGG